MNNTKSKFRLLQLFADGGAEGSAAGTETGATEAVAAPQTGEKDLPITYLDEDNDTANDVPVAEEQQEEAKEEPDLDAEFDALIKKGGKYADVYEKKFRTALNGRMKESKEQSETMQKTQRVIEKLAQVYGVDSSDYEAIEKALDSDDNFYNQAAMDAGMSVEAYKELNRAKAENAVYKKAHEEQIQRERADEMYRKWIDDSRELQKTYPNFNLEEEIKNHVFSGLLRNGFPVENAYLASHPDLVQQHFAAGARQGFSEAEKKLANNIAANQARPAENASSRTSTATVKRDVASLTNEELDEIDRLSRRRRISLG